MAIPSLFYPLTLESIAISSTALRAAAAAVKQEDNRRLFHNAALRKRRKELGDQIDSLRRPNRVLTDALYFSLVGSFGQ